MYILYKYIHIMFIYTALCGLIGTTCLREIYREPAKAYSAARSCFLNTLQYAGEVQGLTFHARETSYNAVISEILENTTCSTPPKISSKKV